MKFLTTRLDLAPIAAAIITASTGLTKEATYAIVQVVSVSSQSILEHGYRASIKKILGGDYLKLMEQELSLNNIKVSQGINKKTEFDWRHKVLSGLENVD